MSCLRWFRSFYGRGIGPGQRAAASVGGERMIAGATVRRWSATARGAGRPRRGIACGAERDKLSSLPHPLAPPVPGIVLVVLQFALIVAIAVPWAAADRHWPGLAAIAAVAAGIGLGAWALTANRLGNFNIHPEPKAGGRLATTGPYALVRHPMYAAVLLATFGCCLAYGTPWRWVAWLALSGVLHVKAGVEERALRARHPGYAAYARRTKRIVPFLW
jgi:protein-S-isoprenylcysteine O-methyltransferase Ste14